MESLVSIIMNCRNGERYLLDALNSIKKQTYQNWELIFVDNNSKDNTKNIFFKFLDQRFKYFFLDIELNLGSARQFALSKCNGEFIAFLDSDDLWMEDKLKKQIPLFFDKEVGLVISNTIFFNDKEEKIYFNKTPKTGYVFYDLLKNYYINLETLVCRKKFIDLINFQFDQRYEMISDYELCLKLSQVCKLAYLNKPLSKWRVHMDSDTWNKEYKFFTEKKIFINNFDFKEKSKKIIKIKKKFIQINNLNLVLLDFQKKKKKISHIFFILKNFNFSQKFLITFILYFVPFSYLIINLLKKNRLKS